MFGEWVQQLESPWVAYEDFQYTNRLLEVYTLDFLGIEAVAC